MKNSNLNKMRKK